MRSERQKALEEDWGWRRGEGTHESGFGHVEFEESQAAGEQVRKQQAFSSSPSPGHKDALVKTCPSPRCFLSGPCGSEAVSLHDIRIGQAAELGLNPGSLNWKLWSFLFC